MTKTALVSLSEFLLAKLPNASHYHHTRWYHDVAKIIQNVFDFFFNLTSNDKKIMRMKIVVTRCCSSRLIWMRERRHGCCCCCRWARIIQKFDSICELPTKKASLNRTSQGIIKDYSLPLPNIRWKKRLCFRLLIRFPSTCQPSMTFMNIHVKVQLSSSMVFNRKLTAAWLSENRAEVVVKLISGTLTDFYWKII